MSSRNRSSGEPDQSATAGFTASSSIMHFTQNIRRFVPVTNDIRILDRGVDADNEAYLDITGPYDWISGYGRKLDQGQNLFRFYREDIEAAIAAFEDDIAHLCGNRKEQGVERHLQYLDHCMRELGEQDRQKSPPIATLRARIDNRTRAGFGPARLK